MSKLSLARAGLVRSGTCGSRVSRSALTWSLILGCWVGICSPVAASPADVRIVAADPVKTSELPTGVGSQFELTFWQSVSASDDADQFEAYLARYPNGTFSALARAKIAALTRRSGPTSAGTMVMHPASPAPSPAASPVDGIQPAATDDGDLVGTAAAIPGAAAAVVTVPVPAASGSVPLAAVKPASMPSAPTQAAPAFTSAATGSAVPPSLAEQLRALGQSQGRRPEPPVSTAPQPSFALPARPELASVPKVELPDHFCTAMDRQNFYNSVYKPARSLADQNDQTVTGHMLKLQSIYDDYAQRKDQNAMDAIAGEVRDYDILATDAHRASTAFEDLFNGLRAVPIRQCPESS